MTEISIPARLYIMATNTCNADCVFCAYRYWKEKKGILSIELFKKAVDEFYNAGGRAIDFTPMLGETFTDPYFLERVEYCRDLGYETIDAYSNMTLFDKIDAERFFSSGITGFYISLSPLDKMSHEKIYRTNRYNELLENVKKLLIASKHLNSTIQKISIEFRSNISLEACKAMIDYKEFIEPHLSKKVQISCMQRFDSYAGAITQEDLVSGMGLNIKESSNVSSCSRLNFVQVIQNGNVRLCGCRIKTDGTKDEMYLGNISKHSLIELYNSDKAQSIKQDFKRQNLPSLCIGCPMSQ